MLESWGYDAGYNLGQETETPAVGTYELDGAGHARLSGEIEIGGLGK